METRRGRIRVRRPKPNEPQNFKEAYRILYLRYTSNRDKLFRCNDRYEKLMVDLVRLGYAEYDSSVCPTKLQIKLKEPVKDDEPVDDGHVHSAFNHHTEERRTAEPSEFNHHAEERRILDPPAREGYESPYVTYGNVTALFMTRTVWLWLIKRAGLVVPGVVAGYLLIEYLKKWQIPI